MASIRNANRRLSDVEDETRRFSNSVFVMPQHNFTVSLRALSYRTTLPKLVLSACNTAPPLVDLGVRGYFSKPVDLSKFKQTVRRLLQPIATGV